MFAHKANYYLQHLTVVGNESESSTIADSCSALIEQFESVVELSNKALIAEIKEYHNAGDLESSAEEALEEAIKGYKEFFMSFKTQTI